MPPTINAVLEDFDSDSLVSSSLSCPVAILVAEESVPSCRLVLPDTTAEASAATAVPSRVDDSVTKATDALCASPPSSETTFRLMVYSLRGIESSIAKVTVNGKSPFISMAPQVITAESIKS